MTDYEKRIRLNKEELEQIIKERDIVLALKRGMKLKGLLKDTLWLLDSWEKSQDAEDGILRLKLAELPPDPGACVGVDLRRNFKEILLSTSTQTFWVGDSTFISINEFGNVTMQSLDPTDFKKAIKKFKFTIEGRGAHGVRFGMWGEAIGGCDEKK